MKLEENIAILKLKIQNAPVENKGRIENLIYLYSTRKIRDVRTVRSVVYALAGREYRMNPNAVIERYEGIVASRAGDEPEPPTNNMPTLVCLPLPDTTPQPRAIERMSVLCMLASFAIGVSLNCLGSFFLG